MDVNEEVEEVKAIISTKHIGESSKKGKSDDDVTYLEDLKEELWRIKDIVEDLVKAQEILEYNILKRLGFEFSKQRFVVKVNEDSKAA